jgi:hypothetical protein
LYLCIFDGDEEVEGIEVGGYSDFADFRDLVSAHVARGTFKAGFPVLMEHSDCDGEWSPEEARMLASELATIARAFAGLPPVELPDTWKRVTAAEIGLEPDNLYECLFDVDGEPLLDRLHALCQISIERNLPILFQ